MSVEQIHHEVIGDEQRSKQALMRFFVEECGHAEAAALILDAAMRLFARKGYAATSVREIVQEAQVTNPMLYYYFQSKEGVFRALVDTLVGSMDRQIVALIEQERDLEQTLKGIAQLHFEAARDVPMVLRFMFSTVFGPKESSPEIDMPKRRMCLMHSLSALFDRAQARGQLDASRGLTPFLCAQMFMGMVSNQLMFALKLGEHVDEDPMYAGLLEKCLSDEMVEQLVGLFLYGALKRDEEVTR